MISDELLAGLLSVAKFEHPLPWETREASGLFAVVDRNNEMVAAYKTRVASETLITLVTELRRLDENQDNR